MSAAQIVVASGNEAQVAAWDGDEGRQWSARHEFYDSSTRHHHAALLEAARISEGDAVLDVGCGNGLTTRDAARVASRGRALGVDLSSQMVALAGRLAAEEGLGNVRFVQADAQVADFDGDPYDIVLSKFGAMFFADQVAGFANLARAMRPGGRLAMVSWQAPDRNEWLSSFGEALTLGRPRPAPPADAPTPFRHADPSGTRAILEAAGFVDVLIEPVEAPMYFGADADEGFAALSEGLGWMSEGLTEQEKAHALERLRANLRGHETPDGVAYGSAAWLIAGVRR